MQITLLAFPKTPKLLPQPHPPKQQYDRRKEPKPRLPPNTRLLRHAEHTIHSAPNLIPRVFKLIIHFLSEGGGVADFVADKMGELLWS